MRFVDMASTFRARIRVSNLTRRSERLDGKSAFEMMLLEATCGNLLKIEAVGADAEVAVSSLAELVETTLTAEPANEQPE